MVNKHIVKRPQRWDRPFAGENMPEDTVARILSSFYFSAMDASNFPARTSLRDIVRNDCRIRTFKKHQLIVRRGEYLNSAFIILSGEVTLVSPPGIDPALWSQVEKKSPKKGRTLFTWAKKSIYPEVRQEVSASAISLRPGRIEPSPTLIPNLAELIESSGVKSKTLSTDKIFGESSVLSRNEMQNTVVAQSEVEVLEIRWQGLRELRQREPAFKQVIDNIYRKRGLYDHLAGLPLFSHLSHDQLQALSQEALFETHGEVEWQHSFKKASQAAKHQKDNSLLNEPELMIAQEGDYPDGLLLLRHGFARVSRKVNNNDYTIGHLHMDSTFGLEELYRGWKQGKLEALNYSLHALGYIDVIRIPSQWLETHIFSQGMESIIERELENSKAHDISDAHTSNAPALDRELSEFLVENRFINGSKAMMIDLERCVRCDDCVTACASAHDNNPRFNRHGKSHGRYMIANACMHCEDPVCMIGCPTGAIHRSQTGIVNINDATCIGCSTCANNCPYDNIRMVNIRNGEGKLYTDADAKPIVKATKCDLCSGTGGKPACEQACSHDALVRIDLKDITSLEEWVDR